MDRGRGHMWDQNTILESSDLLMILVVKNRFVFGCEGTVRQSMSAVSGRRVEAIEETMSSTQLGYDGPCEESIRTSSAGFTTSNFVSKSSILSILPRNSSGRSLVGPMCNSPDEVGSEDEESLELPPPKAIIDRGLPSTMITLSSLSRARSASPKKLDASSQPQERRGMTRVRSMPSLQHDRSAYNRSIGHAVLASVSEHDGSKGRGEAKRRVEEFDELLQEFE